MYPLLARAVCAIDSVGLVVDALASARAAAVADMRTRAHELRLSSIVAGLSDCSSVMRTTAAAARALDIIADLTEGR